MKNLNILISLLFIVLTAVACGPVEEEEARPENVIVSSEGLTIELEWSTGGSVTQALDEIDLDLFLLKDSEVITSSENGSSFEDVTIDDIYSDGDYFIDVEFFSGEIAVDYTLFVRGNESNESNTYSSSFLSSDRGVSVQYLRIEKSGNTYTIFDL